MSNPISVQTLPLAQVHLNPANPRGFINQETVDTLAANMATEGQKTSIKVTPLGMGHYQVVGGDHRVLAARKLGWESIRAEVLDITPDQAFLDAYLDNQGQPMTWFADYRAIETLWNLTDRSKGTQKPIAARLMKSEALVSKAITLMPLLNAPARDAILSLGKNGEGEKATQKAILTLTRLATGQPDDQDRVWATLQVLIRHKMAEPQAKALVAWVQAGNPPDSFDPKAAKVAPKPQATAHTPTPATQADVPSHAHPAKTAPVAKEPVESTHTPKAAAPTPAAMSESAASSSIRTGTAKPFIGKIVKKFLEAFGIFGTVQIVGSIILLIGIIVSGLYLRQNGPWTAFRVVEPRIWPSPVPTPVAAIPTAVPTANVVQAVPTLVTAEPTPAPEAALPVKKTVVAKTMPTTAPTVAPTVVAQSSPVSRSLNSQQTPQGDLFSQGADAAVKGANVADVARHLLPF